MRGRYVALEGIEGSGKSTLARGLSAHLGERGVDVLVVREPGGTALGEELRRLLLHSGDVAPWAEAAMFAAARAQLVAEVVGPALSEGRWVVSDRTYYSSLAYQGGARGLGMDTVRRLNETVLAGVEPDVVLVLRVDPEVGFARESERDRMGAGGLAFQREVAAAYERLIAEDPRVIAIDAEAGPDETLAEVIEAIDAVTA